jgi:hypothetical protein
VADSTSIAFLMQNDDFPFILNSCLSALCSLPYAALTSQPLRGAGRNPQPVSRTPQPVTRIPQPVTRNPYPATRNPYPATRNPSPLDIIMQFLEKGNNMLSYSLLWGVDRFLSIYSKELLPPAFYSD